MYTLTRKLSVICLTLVLSFLVYGCGGSSKQALITDVSLDVVTPGLRPEPGTYTIQPGETANAGDVTFGCLAGGPTCKITVASDGTIMSVEGSAEGMATAMDSASAAAWLAAVAAARQEATDAAEEAARLAAVAAAMEAETEKTAAVAAARQEATDAAEEAARLDAVAAEMEAETEKTAAVAAARQEATDAAEEAARLDAVAAEMEAETEKTAAVAAARQEATDAAEEAARLAAVAAEMEAETEKTAAVAAARQEATDAAEEAARLDAVAAEMEAETEKTAAVAAARQEATDAAEEAARLAAVAAEMEAETEKTAAVAAARQEATDAAEEAARLDAVAAEMEAETEKTAAVAAARQEATDAAEEAARLAAVAAAMEAETEKTAAVAAARQEATDAAEEAARLDAVAAEMEAETEKTAAVAAARQEATDAAEEAARLDAEAAAMEAETERLAVVAMRDEALAALTIANRRANAKSVDLSDLDSNYMTITPGIYTIESGDNMDVGDVNFACPADDGLACEIIVAADEDGDTTVVSGDGLATALHSMAAMNTMTAIELAATTTGALDTVGSANLNEGPLAPYDSATTPIVVERSPSGVTTITLTHVETGNDATGEIKYESEAVDTGHEIAGWMGQTLKRDDSEAADTEADIDAVPASEMDEATFYTNIDPAKVGKAMYEGDAIAATGMRIAVDADQDYSVLNGNVMDGATFKGEFIRMDGTRIPGTFTCDLDAGCALAPATETFLGILLLAAYPGTGWEFESNVNEKEGETPVADYMYFGYWLKSPVGDSPTEYAFATFSGGDADFTNDNRSIYGSTDALTATYEGGAAGMYVSREHRLEDGVVDQFSPGTFGRFTAKAELIAKFGTGHAVPTEQNSLGGTISEFRDGDTDLGFEVILNRRMITPIDGLVTSGTTAAKFGDSGSGTGDWSAKLFGPDVDTNSTDRQKGAFPTGVAGKFDAVTTNSVSTVLGVDQTTVTYRYDSRIVGAFAAERE